MKTLSLNAGLRGGCEGARHSKKLEILGTWGAWLFI